MQISTLKVESPMHLRSFSRGKPTRSQKQVQQRGSYSLAAVNRRVAEWMLARLGYRSEAAEGGVAALDMLAHTTFDAVLMDCRMPDMDGFEATTEIRRLEGEGRHTPIIAMTADAQKSDREYCLSTGFRKFVAL